MGGASSFYAMLAIVAFLIAIWVAGKLSRVIGVSSMVLEVTIGLLLGPNVLPLLPKQLSVCYDDLTTDCSSRAAQVYIASQDTQFCDLGAYLERGKYTPDGEWANGFFGNVTTVTLKGHAYHLDGASSHGGQNSSDRRQLGDEVAAGSHRRLASGGNAGKTDYDSYQECLEEQCGYDLAMKCATTPDIFTIIGHTGVAMMIFESGMHFDFEQAKTVGHWACLVAMLGTFLPIVTGTALAVAYGFEVNPAGLAVGVSLAPTSIGIALKLLHEANALHLYFGQAVMTAAFVDDVLSLILFSVLFSMTGDMTFMTFLPLILGCVFMVVAIAAAPVVWPKLIKALFSKIPEDKPDAGLSGSSLQALWLGQSQ